jgi:hypothetical protein
MPLAVLGTTWSDTPRKTRRDRTSTAQCGPTAGTTSTRERTAAHSRAAHRPPRVPRGCRQGQNQRRGPPQRVQSRRRCAVKKNRQTSSSSANAAMVWPAGDRIAQPGAQRSKPVGWGCPAITGPTVDRYRSPRSRVCSGADSSSLASPAPFPDQQMRAMQTFLLDTRGASGTERSCSPRH